MSDIAELEENVRRLRTELHAATTALQNARIAASGVMPGDVVVSKQYGQCKVIAVKPMGLGQPWLVATLKRKDGTWGNTRRNLFGEWVKQ